MAIRQVSDDIAASAQISRLGKRDRQGKRRRDRRVDRIAPAPQHVAAGLGRMPFLGDHDMLGERLGLPTRIGPEETTKPAIVPTIQEARVIRMIVFHTVSVVTAGGLTQSSRRGDEPGMDSTACERESCHVNAPARTPAVAICLDAHAARLGGRQHTRLSSAISRVKPVEPPEPLRGERRPGLRAHGALVATGVVRPESPSSRTHRRGRVESAVPGHRVTVENDQPAPVPHAVPASQRPPDRLCVPGHR